LKVLVIDSVHQDLLQGLRDLNFEIIEDYSTSKEKLIPKLGEYNGLILRSRFPIDKDFLKAASNLKFIGRVGAGMENIDIPFAQKMGIHLLSAPEGNRDAVAEHAIAMILMLFNNLKRADDEVRNGIWRREENRGLELSGKTIGIIGYGNNGSAFAKKLMGFGSEVLAYDKYKKGFSNNIVREVELDELKMKADILSLHIPQNHETINMLNQEFIDGFSKDFYLINTARGKIVNTKALIEAIEKGKILGACLDVLEFEKSSFENMFDGEMPAEFQQLIKTEKVILSPHIAGWTQESKQKMAATIIQKLKSIQF
jgi:D-3-phosphoglycerate dehydrogenase